jgi:dynein intermediate chain 1
MLNKINAAIKAEGGKVPHDGDEERKKSLRNMFNYQERTSQTFNLPIREKGIKTDPPQTSVFSIETTQWMIFDAYMQEYENTQRAELEEAAKLRSKDKKPQ